jgi:O-methyltransferase
MIERAINVALGPVRRRMATEIYELEKEKYLSGLPAADRSIFERARAHTLTSVERICTLIEAVRHCVKREVPGAFAECGVWRGGSVLAMVLTLQELGVEDRDIHLYDTFEGMTAPTEHDVSPYHPPPVELWKQAERGEEERDQWLLDLEVPPAEVVRATVLSTGYPAEHVHVVEGSVEQTLPDQAPERLALLRLDTDWYESTRHELVHLYPRISEGGVLIVDDYGHWEGCRRAVDEYFRAHASPPLLCPIDYTGRIAVKA